MSRELAPSEPTNRAQRLTDIIMTLQRKFVLGLSKELDQGRISFPQFFLLMQIVQHKHMTMTQVAECMDHSTAAATGLVDRLEKFRYIQRMVSPDDRRKVLVSITEAGRKTVESTRRKIMRGLGQFISQLTAKEQEDWLGIHEKLLAYYIKK